MAFRLLFNFGLNHAPYMFSVNMIPLGKAFQIGGPNDRRLFDPKVISFGL